MHLCYVLVFITFSDLKLRLSRENSDGCVRPYKLLFEFKAPDAFQPATVCELDKVFPFKFLIILFYRLNELAVES